MWKLHVRNQNLSYTESFIAYFSQTYLPVFSVQIHLHTVHSVL